MDPVEPKDPTRADEGPGRVAPGAAPAFDETEVARILARAAELDAMAPTAPLLPPGKGDDRLSLSELESVAIEAGIDPDHVRTAATELIVQRTSPPAAAAPVKAPLGLAERVDTERVIPSAVTETAWGRMVQELREHTGAPGVVSSLGGVREWHSKSEGGPDTMTLRLEFLGTGATRLSVSRNTSASGAMAVLFGASFAGIAAIFAALFVLVPPADGLARLPALLAGLVGMGSLVTGGTIMTARRHLKRIDTNQKALMDRLELLALRGGGEGGR